MSLIGIDVSSYQKEIDWNKVLQSGVKFAILKIIRKDLNVDKQFENNWSGATKYGIPIQGVYNYSYATTVAKAKIDAKRVLAALNGRKTMVWLDVEDDCQKGLGKNMITIINAYGKAITDAGLPFGVYTGQSFYNSYIKPYGGVRYPMWIARYGTNNGKMNVKYQPQIPNMIGWQYTSQGRVDGIAGDVDMDVWYKELDSIYEGSTSHSNHYTEPERLLYYKRLAIMKGNDVKWAQYELVRKGFMPSVNAKGKTNIDGCFGKTTSDAVKAFQKSVGIKVDGKIGAVTRAYLKK